MNRKFLLGTAIAAALMFGASAASACSIGAWSVASGVVAGDAGEPGAGFKRYSGRCGLRVNATGAHFVQDNTPVDERFFRLRFYYFTGDISGSTPIFRARNTGGTSIIQVAHDGTQLSFTTNTGGAAQNVAVLDNRYYSIELAWAAGTVAPPTTGSLTGTVTGASGNATSGQVAGTVNFTGLANTADSITDAQMGLITGATTVTAPVYFDEYDSRRTTNPGRLCRGDAASPLNNTVNVFDAVAVINDASGVPANLSIGQPDANEDGIVNVFDGVAVIAIAGSVNNVCPTP